jgi:hypothetical protein
MYSEDSGERSSFVTRPAEPGPGRHQPATSEDAEKHGIPADYQLTNWDPTEEPILLLESVFDANSLGKWIYDWTVAKYGPQAPFSDVANNLWLLLIQLAGNINRAEEYLRVDGDVDDKDVMEDFIDSGRRQMAKLQRLLRACEEPMLNSPGEGKVLGHGSGIEFVNTFFGRDRRLHDTEQFMQDLELWIRRWNDNCESILEERRGH